MKRALVLCAVVGVAVYAASAWSASPPSALEKQLQKDVATLKTQVKTLQKTQKAQTTAVQDLALLAIVLPGCSTELTVDAIQSTWQVIDQISSATQAGKTYFGPQTTPIVNLAGKDLCDILGISRSQVVPPTAAQIQAFLAGFNSSSAYKVKFAIRP
jgi:hypothetical protein